jgi:adenylylsulfate kinase
LNSRQAAYGDERWERCATGITRMQRLQHAPRTLWLTGLSGAGKSTIATALEKELVQRGHACFVLDGDTVRAGLNRDLGFTPADRVENIRRIGEVARLMNKAGLIVIAAVISPYRADRAAAGGIIGTKAFREIHVSTPLAVCEERDPKGLYRRARTGALDNFTGVSAPYEAPLTPDLRIDAASVPVTRAVQMLLEAAGIAV